MSSIGSHSIVLMSSVCVCVSLSLWSWVGGIFSREAKHWTNLDFNIPNIILIMALSWTSRDLVFELPAQKRAQYSAIQCTRVKVTVWSVCASVPLVASKFLDKASLCFCLFSCLFQMSFKSQASVQGYTQVLWIVLIADKRTLEVVPYQLYHLGERLLARSWKH